MPSNDIVRTERQVRTPFRWRALAGAQEVLRRHRFPANLPFEHHKFGERMGVNQVERLLARGMAHVGPILERKRAEARAYLASALERTPAEG